MISFYLNTDTGVEYFKNDTYEIDRFLVIDRPATDEDKALHSTEYAEYLNGTTPADPEAQ